MFNPKINGSLEGLDFLKWVLARLNELMKFMVEVRAFMARMEKGNSTGARQTADINIRTRDLKSHVQEFRGIPAPPLLGAVLRGDGAEASWTREWQGLMPHYSVSLDPAGGSYFVEKVGLASDSATDRALSKAVLPPVLFDDGGLTMLPIETEIGSVKVHTPMHLYVDVNPSFAEEEFTIYLPPFANGFGPTAPFYTFMLENVGAFDAIVHIEDTDLIYTGTLEPVMGDVNSWTIEPGFSAAWSVQNVVGAGAVAMPSAIWTGAAAVFTDDYYQTNVYTP